MIKFSNEISHYNNFLININVECLSQNSTTLLKTTILIFLINYLFLMYFNTNGIIIRSIGLLERTCIKDLVSHLYWLSKINKANGTCLTICMNIKMPYRTVVYILLRFALSLPTIVWWTLVCNLKWIAQIFNLY